MANPPLHSSLTGWVEFVNSNYEAKNMGLLFNFMADLDVNWDLLIRNFGVPGAMMVAALLFVASGRIKFKIHADRENQQWAEKYALLELQWAARYADLEDRCKAENETWATRYSELKAESLERIGHLRTEKDMWRDSSLKAITLAADAAKKAPTP